MARVQFPNKVKYTGTWYPAHTPFDVKASDLDMLVAKGAIVLAVAPIEEEDDEEPDKVIAEETQTKPENGEGVAPAVTQEDNQDTVPTKTELLNMTTAEVKEYAAKLGVDLIGCTNNTQRVAKIMEHFSK